MTTTIANDDVTLASTTETQAELDHAVSLDWRKPFAAPDAPSAEPSKKDAPKTPAESDPAKVQSKEGEKPEEDEPLPKGAQKRIDKLTKQLREAEAKLGQRTPAARPEPAKPAGDAEPQEKDFKEWKDFNKAHTAWAVREENRQEAQRRSQREQEEETRSVVETYSERMEAYKAEHPEFDEQTAVDTPWKSDNPKHVQSAIAFRLAVIEADNGPAILHHLANHPEEFAEFGKLTPVQVGIRVGRISAQLSPSDSAKPAPKPPISNAPAPVTPPRGSHTAPTSITDPEISTDDFIRRRNEQERKNRRR
jgi:hypothetical protein